MATVPGGLNFNDLLDDDDVDLIFSLEEEIASGSFGTVYKVSIIWDKRRYTRDLLWTHFLVVLGYSSSNW